MKSSLLSLATLVLPALGELTLRKRDVPAVVGFDIKRKDIPNPIARDQARRKRADTVSVTLQNEEYIYLCNVTLGSPGQTLYLVLDTGSSDLWVNTPNSTFCEENSSACNYYGTYNASKSSTYAYVNSDFNISYADGSGASGYYATETLTIGGTEITDLQFGIGYESSSEEGVLGIGYITNEALVSTEDTTYANLPKTMVNKGLIKSNAYSLWLNDLDSNEGSILFGGVNTEKYHGSLSTLPIDKTGNEYSAFYITLTGVSVTNSSGTTNYSSSAFPAAALLDSGSSLTYLPNGVVEDIYDVLGVSYDEQLGYGFIACSAAKKDVNISYTFSSPVINVGIAELVLDIGNDEYFSNGEQACAFGIAPAGESSPVLGDTFLRSAYVVYDLANNEISLANTKFGSTGSNIEEIGSGSDSVPDSTSVANAVTTVVAGGGSGNIGVPTGEVTIVGSKNPAPPGPTHMPRNMALGLAGAALLIL
ncbi:uncharacterized protein N7483_012238 [Penicillium malachiteum]|uniref:uncharacterized protein n=1 Tax=Penicillium malachiteum TaxID=1324776 RepID=UPI002546EB3E|nr:uncharacterized protein N7483_012238 [Penicillium malachiteum]KAJ5715057.1 hypothetical protein N7483_012238 [Penicillium malachiteum]